MFFLLAGLGGRFQHKLFFVTDPIKSFRRDHPLERRERYPQTLSSQIWVAARSILAALRWKTPGPSADSRELQLKINLAATGWARVSPRLDIICAKYSDVRFRSAGKSICPGGISLRRRRQLVFHEWQSVSALCAWLAGVCLSGMVPVSRPDCHVVTGYSFRARPSENLSTASI